MYTVCHIESLINAPDTAPIKPWCKVHFCLVLCLPDKTTDHNAIFARMLFHFEPANQSVCAVLWFPPPLNMVCPLARACYPRAIYGWSPLGKDLAVCGGAPNWSQIKLPVPGTVRQGQAVTLTELGGVFIDLFLPIHVRLALPSLWEGFFEFWIFAIWRIPTKHKIGLLHLICTVCIFR